MSPESGGSLASGLADALAIDNVSKSYGRIQALKAVSFTVRPGEFVGLLGPNGAGKSTLFQLLTGLFVPDSGAIRIQGLDIRRDLVSVLSRIGVVFQQPTLDPELSVIANLRYHARLHGMGGRTRERIRTELDRLELTPRSRSRARTLSGGNRRRVELARALLADPQILLMDEATVGLDPASRRDILDYVLQLRRERNMAILWATHLVDEAEQADRIVLLHKGEVLRDSTPLGLVAETGQPDLQSAFLQLTGHRGEAVEE